MFLKDLKIENGHILIRRILFKKGLNLIIDETKTSSITESGNNVGKTTVLRLIDFCFGSDGVNVYKDTEFRDKTNTQIETFLKENNVIISLTIKEDLDVPGSREIVIRKNFLKGKERIQEINGEYYNDKDFDLKLKELIFHSTVDKPTFRQIVAKNIRYEKTRLENTIKVLHTTTTFEQYEALYFFWLGIDTDTASRKQKLHAVKAIEEAVLKRLRRDGTLSEVRQALSVIERDIEELNKKKSNFNINENYENDLNQLNNISAKINRLSTHINQISLRRDLILESRDELENEYANVDVIQLEDIYKTAQSFVPALHRKFEELVSFHNDMLREKIKFVTNELPSLEDEFVRLNKELQANISEEHLLGEKLKKAGAIDELEEVITKLNGKHEQKGKYEEQLRQWEESNEKLGEIDKELEEINQGIASQDKMLEERILNFNKFFSKISEKLYDEQFILSHEKNDRAYQLRISTIGGNLGTGKKKGQIAAFDIAYIQFCENYNIPCAHFILHDQIENIHDNQLSLIAEVVANINVQFIVPVLRDKLPADINPDIYKVLSLSQSDKLFKV